MSMDLEVLLKSRIASVTSPTHPLTLLQKSRVQVPEKDWKICKLILSEQEYDVQKLKLSGGFGNQTELNRDLVVLVESSTPHQPSLVVEVEDSEVKTSRSNKKLRPIKG